MYVIEKGGLCEEIGDMPTFDPVCLSSGRVLSFGAKLCTETQTISSVPPSSLSQHPLICCQPKIVITLKNFQTVRKRTLTGPLCPKLFGTLGNIDTALKFWIDLNVSTVLCLCPGVSIKQRNPSHIIVLLQFSAPDQNVKSTLYSFETLTEYCVWESCCTVANPLTRGQLRSQDYLWNQTSQELRMLSSVTLNFQVTKIVMNSGSQMSQVSWIVFVQNCPKL